MKVLLIDDHPLILTALQAVISGLGEDIAVTGAQSAAQAWACLRDTPDFDLALLDLVLGDADGFEVLAQMRQEHPQVPVVILSASENAGDVVRALDLGAMGFVPKRASTQALVEALRIVMSGGLFVPQHLFGPNRGRAPEVAGPQDLAGAVAKSLEHLGLTPRQHDVLSGLLKGLPNKLIARELSLSVDTVKDHVASVLRALHVTSENQRVREFAEALRSGDLVEAGRIVRDGHESLRLLYATSTPVMDAAVEQLCATPGVYGARMTGGGFGGCVVALAEPGALSQGWVVQAVDGARAVVGD